MATEGEAKMQRLETTVAKLEELVRGLAAWKASAEATRQRDAARPAATSSAGGVCFPPYGRSKGLPVSGASAGDLEFYRTGCLRTLSDESKARWHDKERTLLAAIDDELSRQGGAAPGDGPPPLGDADAPPNADLPF